MTYNTYLHIFISEITLMSHKIPRINFCWVQHMLLLKFWKWPVWRWVTLVCLNIMKPLLDNFCQTWKPWKAIGFAPMLWDYLAKLEAFPLKNWTTGVVLCPLVISLLFTFPIAAVCLHFVIIFRTSFWSHWSQIGNAHCKQID